MMLGWSPLEACRRFMPVTLVLLLALLSGGWSLGTKSDSGTTPPGSTPLNLAGSYVAFDPSAGGVPWYSPGYPQDFVFRTETFTTDGDRVFFLWLRFPAGWVIHNVEEISSSCSIGYVHYAMDWSFETPGQANEIRIEQTRMQSTNDHCTVYYRVRATPPAGVSPAPVSWYYGGEHYGSPPYSPCSADRYTPASWASNPCDQWVNPQAVIPLPPPGVHFTPAALATGACAGSAQTITLRLFNISGQAGDFLLSYDVPTANGTLSGPSSLHLENGETATLDVVLSPDSGAVLGELVTAQVTASAMFVGSDTATITATVAEGYWTDAAPEPDGGRADNLVVGHAGLLWSITGEGVGAEVRTYDPITDSWATLPGTAPPFGTSHARSGAVSGNKVYTYGDGRTAGFTGLWSFDMATLEWVNENPGGTPPASANLWAPAWVTDPETGWLYITGGAPGWTTSRFATVSVYDPAANLWLEPLPDFTTARNEHAAFIFRRPSDNHKLLCIVGGSSSSILLNSTQCYDFDTGTWNAENADVPPPPFRNWWGMGYAQKVHWFTETQLWMAGGNEFFTAISDAYFYDVNSGLWVDGSGAYSWEPAFRGSMALLDNELYTVGGFSHYDILPTDQVAHHVQCAAPPCTVECSAAATPVGGASLDVDFTSSVRPRYCPDPVTYAWNFGDGGTSTVANPTHTYAAGGAYGWSLTVASGASVCQQSGTVSVCELACLAGPDVSAGVAPLLVSFTASADATGCTEPVIYQWDFGDGGASTEQNPTHLYSLGGTYPWTLTVTSGVAECAASGTVTVCGINSCTAAADPGYGAVPLTVAFAGTVDYTGCTGTPTWAWTFGDGGTSTDQNPVHQYAAGGVYAYSLTVSVDGSSCTTGGTVTVCAVTNCAAIATPDYGAAPLTVNFTGAADLGVCAGTPAWAWTFGDGGTSNLQNPTHQYAAGGTYTYSLTVTVDGSSCTTGGTVTVCAVTNCAAIATPDYGAAPLTVNFAGSADLGVCAGTAAWAWTFGDGATSTEQNPVHPYAAGGVYAYSLTVSVDGSSCTTGGAVTVCQVQCTASASTASGLVPLAVSFTTTVDSGVCADPVEYWWDFGDGATSAEANPTHTYTVGGTHTWTLTVTSGDSVCTQTGTVYADPYDLSFYDDLGRARLCANSVTGEFCWTALSGSCKGAYTGVALRTTVPGLLTFSSPPWAPWQLLFRYYNVQKRGAGVFMFRNVGIVSALTDTLTTNNPAACN